MKKLKKQLRKLIKHLESAMATIQDEYGISQDEIDNKGRYCSLNRGNSIYAELGRMQRDITITEKMLKKPNRNAAKTLLHQ